MATPIFDIPNVAIALSGIGAALVFARWFVGQREVRFIVCAANSHSLAFFSETLASCSTHGRIFKPYPLLHHRIPVHSE
jgi:hypothetical protein